MPTCVESIDGGLVGTCFHEDGEDSHVVLMMTDQEGVTIRLRLHPEVADALGAEIRKDASHTPIRPD